MLWWHNKCLMSCDHESPRDQIFVGGSDRHQPQQHPASASAAATALQSASASAAAPALQLASALAAASALHATATATATPTSNDSKHADRQAHRDAHVLDVPGVSQGARMDLDSCANRGRPMVKVRVRCRRYRWLRQGRGVQLFVPGRPLFVRLRVV